MYAIIRLCITLAMFALASHAQANVCAANTNGKTAQCGAQAGQCFYQAAWGADALGPFPNTNAGSCCYDPATQECGAGAFVGTDTVATPVVTAKKEFMTSRLGRDLKACGVVAIPQSSTCRTSESCTVIGYTGMCPLSFICTNDIGLCPESSSSNCPSGHSCAGQCYDDQSHFCFEGQIYSKTTHSKCNDGRTLIELSPTQACCGNRTIYNPRQQSCVNGIVHDPATEGVCGSRIYQRASQGCCSDTIYDLATQDCDKSHVVALGNKWSTECNREYNPDTHACKKGRPPFASHELCRIGEEFALNRCYVPGSAAIGDACASDDQCAKGKCNGIEGLSRGTCVCKTDSDCGLNGRCKLGPLGIGQNKCLATSQPTCPNGWTYETRNPLNKDRCNRTTTRTAQLQCKLLITDKAANWTGPHAQAGEDECRSTKGKSPKGVKCPGGYRHNIRAGADTCTKEETEHQTPSCPDGWDYKSQSGQDICQEK